MPYKLFIDDIRNISDIYPSHNPEEWILARNGWEAINIIKEKGMPIYIAFDHDLGLNLTTLKPERSGYDVATMIYGAVERGIWSLPEGFSFGVHSANPIGAENIRNKMNDLIKAVQSGAFNDY